MWPLQMSTHDGTRLTADELALWHAWKGASEAVRTRVAAEIAAATGLSDPDFGVLTRVAELGHGRMRQSQLAESMGYHRSRLSHHLTRMEERGLVIRDPAPGGVEIVITDAGRAAVTQARPVHAAAVRKYLTAHLPEADRAHLKKLLSSLSAARPAPG
jgi:DNA-binding MarR family transcriptional regulator